VIILGIDTSCDDTGIGIVRDGQVIANIVASQTALHASFGGVMPEQASREHLSVIDTILEQALQQAKIKLTDIDAVAATYGPGLVGALLVGLTYAKTLAWGLEKPFIPIHHLEGHIASSRGDKFEVLNPEHSHDSGGCGDLVPRTPTTDGTGLSGFVTSSMGPTLEPPFLCLIASGGHTSLFDVQAWGDYRELGRSRDDAAGEAFDKVARLLGLGFPGGPALSKAAETGNDRAYPLTIALRGQEGFDFSFSGLKTAVSLLVQKDPDINVHDLAASFEKTVVESLIKVTERAAKVTGYKHIVVAGGVAANKRLRQRFSEIGLVTHFPPLQLATDNGAMIALAAQFHLQENNHWQIDASPYLPLDTNLRSSASS
jgi:N6-L-threonylcarbamoyladenine synthase